MQRTQAELEAELEKLQPQDFNLWNISGNGLQRLDVLLPALVAVSPPREAALAILCLIERLSNTPDLADCDLGSPGPMVHELEKLAGYEPHLISSVTLFPTPLTVWMVNRLMNGLEKGDKRWASLLEVLKRSAIAKDAAPGAREDAKQFLLHQETR